MNNKNTVENPGKKLLDIISAMSDKNLVTTTTTDTHNIDSFTIINDDNTYCIERKRPLQQYYKGDSPMESFDFKLSSLEHFTQKKTVIMANMINDYFITIDDTLLPDSDINTALEDISFNKIIEIFKVEASTRPAVPKVDTSIANMTNIREKSTQSSQPRASQFYDWR